MRLLSPQLQTFLCVANEGSVHGAARVLKLTQTAVTRRLASLEQDVGASLFTRSRRGMRPTEAGLALLTYCRQVTELEGEALARMSGAKSDAPAHLRVCGPSSVLRSRIIERVGVALEPFPNVTVEFQVRDDGTGRDALKKGQADLAVLAHDEVADEFSTKNITPEQYILVGPKKWARRQLVDVIENERIVDFDPTDKMTIHWLEKFGWRGQAHSDRHYANNIDALAAMVEQGFGYSVLATQFAQPFLDADRLAVLAPGKKLEYPIALAWYPRKHMPASLGAVVKAIR